MTLALVIGCECSLRTFTPSLFTWSQLAVVKRHRQIFCSAAKYHTLEARVVIDNPILHSWILATTGHSLLKGLWLKTNTNLIFIHLSWLPITENFLWFPLKTLRTLTSLHAIILAMPNQCSQNTNIFNSLHDLATVWWVLKFIYIWNFILNFCKKTKCEWRDKDNLMQMHAEIFTIRLQNTVTFKNIQKDVCK